MLSAPVSTNRKLVLLMVLVAGCVDAVGFKNTQIFPANMTGNAVLIASSLGSASPVEPVARTAMTLLSFCMGCALGALLIRILRKKHTFGIGPLLVLSGLLLCACGISLFFNSVPRSFSTAHLLMLAVAMGMQSSAAFSMSTPGAGITTVITSTLTAAISTIMDSFYRLFSKEEKPNTGADTYLPLLVFGCYLTGALLGVFLLGISTAMAILLAGVILASVGVTMFSSGKS